MLITDPIKHIRYSYPHYEQVLHNGINDVFSGTTSYFIGFQQYQQNILIL
jgi:hypothetical protein